PAFAAAPERPATRVAAPATEPPAPAVVAPAASGRPERPRVAPEPFVLAVPPPPPPIFIPAMPSQRRRTPLVSQPAATSSPSSPDGFAPAAPEPRFVVPPKEPVFAPAAAPN